MLHVSTRSCSRVCHNRIRTGRTDGRTKEQHLWFCNNFPENNS